MGSLLVNRIKSEVIFTENINPEINKKGKKEWTIIMEENNQNTQAHTLTEEELAEVSGGITENRWNSGTCGTITKAKDRCSGNSLTMLGIWCDHYSRSYLREDIKDLGRNTKEKIYRHRCSKGRFDYEGNGDGHPR